MDFYLISENFKLKNIEQEDLYNVQSANPLGTELTLVKMTSSVSDVA